MKRTVAIKIKPFSEVPSKALLSLEEFQCLFSTVCNEVSRIAFEKKQKNRVRLHHLCYRDIRNRYPQLGSQMVCNAIAKVSNSYRVLKSFPHKAVRFRSSASVHFDKRTYSLKGTTLSLFTHKGRVKVECVLGPYQKKMLESGIVKEAELVRRGNQWYFHLVVECPQPLPKEEKEVLGVDFGENVLAATSSGKLFGGGLLRMDRDKHLACRSRLQRNGSQSARQTLRHASGREKRHVRHVNHEVSKGIVDEAIRCGCGIIVLEDLTNIRKRIRAGTKVRSRLHRWPFSQLREFVTYKAEAKGIAVKVVSPAYTSRTCSVCGTLGTRRKHSFTCSNCGSRQHSDLNASRNLVWLAPSAEGATGTVNYPHVACIV